MNIFRRPRTTLLEQQGLISRPVSQAKRLQAKANFENSGYDDDDEYTGPGSILSLGTAGKTKQADDSVFSKLTLDGQPREAPATDREFAASSRALQALAALTGIEYTDEDVWAPKPTPKAKAMMQQGIEELNALVDAMAFPPSWKISINRAEQEGRQSWEVFGDRAVELKASVENLRARVPPGRVGGTLAVFRITGVPGGKADRWVPDLLVEFAALTAQNLGFLVEAGPDVGSPRVSLFYAEDKFGRPRVVAEATDPMDLQALASCPCWAIAAATVHMGLPSHEGFACPSVILDDSIDPDQLTSKAVAKDHDETRMLMNEIISGKGMNLEEWYANFEETHGIPNPWKT